MTQARAEKKRFIPVCEPLFLGREAEYAAEAVRSGWISSAGRFIKEFEEGFARYCGAEFGTGTTSGTSALHLALLALGVKEGDEVIIPDFTMAAVMFAVMYCGARPVFVDADPLTWNINPGGIRSRITKKTKAIIAVHTYGHPCDMDPIREIAREHGLPVLEDAAEAHGALYKGKRCGGLSEIAAFSFYGNKIMTTGEGGMVLTSDPELAGRCRYYKNLCFPLKGKRDFYHDDLGFNYRMTNIQAALGLAQLEHVEEFVRRRRAHAAYYNAQLGTIGGIQTPVEKSDVATNVYWMYGILLDPGRAGFGSGEFASRLRELGVDTRPFFRPMHAQAAYTKVYGKHRGDFPVSKDLSERGLYLPSGSGLSEEDLKFVCDAVRKILSGA